MFASSPAGRCSDEKSARRYAGRPENKTLLVYIMSQKKKRPLLRGAFLFGVNGAV